VMLDFGLGLGFNYSALSAAIQRYITRLSAAADMYYTTDSQVSLPSDFVVRFSITAVSGGATKVILGQDSSNFTCVLSSGAVAVFMGGAQVCISPGDLVTDGYLHTIEIKRSGSNVDLSIDGALFSSGSSTAPYLFSYVGRTSGGFFYTGVIADIYAESSGNPVVSFAIDAAGSVSVIQNAVDPLNNMTRVNQPLSATELYTLNTATTPDQWGNADKTKIIPIASTGQQALYQGQPVTYNSQPVMYSGA